MMKKIAAIAATTLSLSILSLAPSQAAEGDLVASSGGSCTTSGGAAPADLINIRVYDEANGTFLTRMNFEDSNKRAWTWKLYHNGDQSAKGSFDLAGTNGSTSIYRQIADFSGTDRVRYEVINASGLVVCETRVGVDYGN